MTETGCHLCAYLHWYPAPGTDCGGWEEQMVYECCYMSRVRELTVGQAKGWEPRDCPMAQHLFVPSGEEDSNVI